MYTIVNFIILKQKYYIFKTSDKMFLLIYKIDSHNRMFDLKHKSTNHLYFYSKTYHNMCLYSAYTPVIYIKCIISERINK